MEIKDKNISEYVGKVLTGFEFNKYFPNVSKTLIKLTKNYEKIYYADPRSYKTGLNEVDIPFNPRKGWWNPGGIHFTDIDNLPKNLVYFDFGSNRKDIMKFCRKVKLPDDCKIYIEDTYLFKADKIELDERVEIKDLPCWSDKEYCVNAAAKSREVIRFIRNLDDEMQISIVNHDPFAIVDILKCKVNVPEEVKLIAVKKDGGIISFLIEYKSHLSEDVILAAVKQKGKKRNNRALWYLLYAGIKVSEDIKLAAVEQNRYVIQDLSRFNMKISDEIRLAASKIDDSVIDEKYSKHQSDGYYFCVIF